MKILYLTQHFPPEGGAGQSRAFQMVRHLERLGHKVTVLTEFPNHPTGIVSKRYKYRFFQKEVVNGIEVMRSYVKASPSKNFVNRIICYLSFMLSSIFAGMKLKERYDLIFATSPPLFVGLSGYILSRFKKTKFVFEIRDIWPETAIILGELKNRLLIKWSKKIEKLCYLKSEKIIVVTKGIYDHLIEKGKVTPQKIELVYNGSDVELFRPKSQKADFKEKYGYKDKFVVLYAGNFGLILGMSKLVEVAKLLETEDRIQFLFIGEGPKKKEVINLRDQYGLKNLRILESVSEEKIVDYYNLADVCLVPSRRIKFSNLMMPLKMYDAWSCGRPIILSIDGEAKYHLNKAKGGICVVPEDVIGIRDAILYLYNNPKLCEEYGKNGRKYVERNFSRTLQAEKLEKVLVNIIGTL